MADESTTQFNVSDYVDVYARASALGLAAPMSLAILPRGFATAASVDELSHEANAASLRKLWQQEHVTVHQLQPPHGKLPTVVQRSADWIAPTIFVGSLLFSQNPIALQLALEVLGSYLTDALRGLSTPTVKLTLIVEEKNGNRFTKCEYEGPVEGLRGLPKILKDVHEGKH